MPDLPPVPDIIRSAYATLIVTDLAESRRFWVDLLGFVVTCEDSSSLYLRGYDELTHHNVILRAGTEAAAGPLGFRVRSPADLDRAEAYYKALGCRSERLPAGAVRGLGEVVRVEDPLGFLIDFFDSSEHPERRQQRYDLRRGAEVGRFDHFNICVPDVPRAYQYYSGLGFGLSETIEDGQTLYAAWMYRKQTVHDMAFTGGDGPRLHHLGFFAHEAHAVLRICDILGSLSLEHHIERGPGRHGVSTPTGTGSRSTPPTTTPATRTTPCSAGRYSTNGGATSGATRSSRPGTPRHPPSWTWTERSGRSPKSPRRPR